MLYEKRGRMSRRLGRTSQTSSSSLLARRMSGPLSLDITSISTINVRPSARQTSRTSKSSSNKNSMIKLPSKENLNSVNLMRMHYTTSKFWPSLSRTRKGSIVRRSYSPKRT